MLPHRLLLRKTFPFALGCLIFVYVPNNLTAQQKILWEGAVKPAEINVYRSASSNDPIATTLKQGAVVDVSLEISAMGTGWCRVSISGQLEPLGYVLCLNLERTGITPNHIVRTEQAPMQSPATVTRAEPTEAAVINRTVLTNKDILDLNRIGLSPQILVAKIKSSQCNFDTSSATLKELKTAGLNDLVILAMVEVPVGPSQVSSPPARETPADSKPILPDVSTRVQQQGNTKPCVILKRMGPADEVTRHLYSFGIRGKQFQAVEGQLPTGVSFHGRLTDHDVRNIQNKGGKVVVIEPKYTTVDLDHARQECHEE
jgi:hypothetical protein